MFRHLLITCLSWLSDAELGSVHTLQMSRKRVKLFRWMNACALNLSRSTDLYFFLLYLTVYIQSSFFLVLISAAFLLSLSYRARILINDLINISLNFRYILFDISVI